MIFEVAFDANEFPGLLLVAIVGISGEAFLTIRAAMFNHALLQ